MPVNSCLPNPGKGVQVTGRSQRRPRPRSWCVSSPHLSTDVPVRARPPRCFTFVALLHCCLRAGRVLNPETYWMSTLRRNSAAPRAVSPPRARPHSPQRHPPAKHSMCGGTGSPRTPTPLGADRRRVLPGVPEPRVCPPDRFVDAGLMLEISFGCLWGTHYLSQRRASTHIL